MSKLSREQPKLVIKKSNFQDAGAFNEIHNLVYELTKMRQNFANSIIALEEAILGPGGELDAATLNSQPGTYYLDRINHTGVQAPATISPQGPGSSLDADTLDGYHASELLAAGSTDIKIAIIGDSLSAPSSFRDSWAWQLQRLTNQMGLPVTIKNWAECGSTFYSALNDHTVHQSGTRSQVEQAIAQGADIVFIALGINDALFVGGYTASEIINNATALRDQLRAGLPSARLIYIEEAPHDIDSLGLSPTSLPNKQCIPWSHGLISYLGRTNCRVNNSTYENTASSKLSNHQTWGTATATIRTLFDAYFTVNVWKIARCGCRIDFAHMDSFGHMLWAHTVLRWFKDNNNVDNQILNIGLWTDAGDKYLIDPDSFFNLVVANDQRAAAVGRYNDINILARARSWFYGQPYWRPAIDPSYPSELYSADYPVTISFDNCEPQRPIYLSWNNGSFIAANKQTTIYGDFNHSWSGSQVLPSWDWSPGTKNLAYAVSLSDGTNDVYEVPIVLLVNPIGADMLDGYHAGNASGQIPVSNGTVCTNLNADKLDGRHATEFARAFGGAHVYRPYSSMQSISTGTMTFVSWTSESYDTNSIWSSSDATKLIVPSGVTRIRLQANIRWADKISTGNERGAWFQKNATTPGADTSVPGLEAVWSVADTAGRASLSYSSPIIAVTSGDHFKLSVYQNSGASLGVSGSASMEIIQ
jgi:hypothetical protein